MTYTKPDLKLVGRATGIVLGQPLLQPTLDRIAGVLDPPETKRYTTDGVLDVDDGIQG